MTFTTEKCTQQFPVRNRTQRLQVMTGLLTALGYTELVTSLASSLRFAVVCPRGRTSIDVCTTELLKSQRTERNSLQAELCIM